MAVVTFDTGVKQIRGKSGNINFAKTKYGVEYKSNPVRTKPQSAAQLAQQTRLKKAAATFATLTGAQNTAWQTYAQNHPITTKNGDNAIQSAYSAFAGLFTKFIQVNPLGTFPTAPPSVAFGGDAVTVTVAATTGKISFTANKANAVNVTTELLLQPLKNIYRKPTNNYPSLGFFPFTSGGLTTSLTVTPGAYSVAIRFVNSATGQQVDKVVLGSFNAA